ncbi:hypothetical protein MNBD_GAMMA21-2846 [hydrothermal vent metagenome]|uniref:Uncharacterized protein n=1 Tax=hydrothermal vent metagenome TaxID=652676 RepID=A0A3B1A4N9_9ZZZZ
MKSIISFLAIVAISISVTQAREVTITMNKVNAIGIGDALGVVVINETESGLRMTPFLFGMPAGNYTLTINETLSCHSSPSDSGIPIPAMAAGKSLWRLPDMKVSAGMETFEPMYLADVGFSDISRRSIVISKRADSTLGYTFGGERIACGSLEQY